MNYKGICGPFGLGSSWRPPGTILGPSCCHSGSFRGLLVGLLGSSWEPLGPFWGHLGGPGSGKDGLLITPSVWSPKFSPCGPFAAVLGRFGAILGLSWSSLVPSWGSLGPLSRRHEASEAHRRRKPRKQTPTRANSVADGGEVQHRGSRGAEDGGGCGEGEGEEQDRGMEQAEEDDEEQ